MDDNDTINGWFKVEDGLPLNEVPVLVYGKGWSSMAVAHLAQGFKGIDGNKYDDIGKVMWRTMRGAPIGQSVHSNPVQVWRYLPPCPKL
ncbi:MAG TPA: hypothetical protein PLZ24_16745 [Flavobacteriales bacterium]|nr:hypothetical protein [Flavobacteriales bacterium]